MNIKTEIYCATSRRANCKPNSAIASDFDSWAMSLCEKLPARLLSVSWQFDRQKAYATFEVIEK